MVVTMDLSSPISRPALPVLALLGALCAGCMAPPVVWRHDTGDRRFAPSGSPLLVLPIADGRTMENEDASLLNLVPLVLWTTNTEHAFDRILLREGTRRHSVPNNAMYFNALRDLHEAIAVQLGVGRRFGPVFRNTGQSGPWPGAKNKQLTVRMDLKALSLTHTHLRYGLGPLASVAFALGAPRRHVRLNVLFDLELKDAGGQRLHLETVNATKTFYDGWYSGLDAEQRALTETSYVLSEALDRLQEQHVLKSGTATKGEGR
jgi:hypothetical protein